MSKDDPAVGDTFEVYIARESGSGNLVCAHGERYHVVPDGDATPAPRERWTVEVASVAGIVELRPIEEVRSGRVVDDGDFGSKNDLLSGGKL